MSNTNEVNFKKLHEQSFENKELLSEASKAGCFHCLKEFNTSKIKQWTDEDKTALCPHCEVDAVLPLSEEVNSSVLKEMNEVWFSPILGIKENSVENA